MSAKKRIISYFLVFIVCAGFAVVSPAQNNTVEAKVVCVYYAQYSKKYHSKKSCRTLSRSKKFYKTTKKKTKKKGLKACKVCH